MLELREQSFLRRARCSERSSRAIPLYAENFPIWSEQGHGIALYATWLALAEKNIGMNVQHYNPLVDAQLADKYDIPANWKLRAQAPFGQIVAPAGDKDIKQKVVSKFLATSNHFSSGSQFGDWLYYD